MSVGSLIKSIRINKGISQSEACSNAVSQSNYSKFELEKIDISSSALIQIINNLDISLDEFFFLYDKENKNLINSLINRFFKIHINNPIELIKFREEALDLLSLSNSKSENNTLNRIVQLSYALEDIAKNENYELAKKFAIPIWEYLQKNDRWFLREIILLNTILYIFPIKTAHEIVKRSLRFLDDYENHNSHLLIKLNLHINFALLNIKENDYKTAIEYLLNAINITSPHTYEFHKKTSQLRLAYCKANLNEPFEEHLMSIVMYFTSTNSLPIFEQLKIEAKKYCVNPIFIQKLEHFEQKVKTIL